MKKIRNLKLLLFWAILSSLSAKAQEVINLSTGWDNGMVSVGTYDDTWTVTQPNGVTSTPRACTLSAWEESGINRWISPHVFSGEASEYGTEGLHTYTADFEITSNDIRCAALEVVGIGGDNILMELRINGNLYPLALPSPSHFQLTNQNVTIMLDPSHLNVGANTMTIEVENLVPQYQNIESLTYTGLNFCGSLHINDGTVEANTQPINHTGVDIELVNGSLHEVIKFCEGDPILFDGSASENENAYHLTVNPVLAGGGLGTSIYEDWVATTAPNSFDLLNQFGNTYSLITGEYYLFRFAVGPCWDAEFYYFKVEECCPDELILELDCENQSISITNIPTSATDIDVNWYWSGSTKPLKESGSTLSISNGNGTYSASVSYILPNGMVCHLGGNILFSTEACCDIIGPHFSSPGAIEDNPATYEIAQTDPFGPVEVSVVDCRPILEIDAECENRYFVAIEPWIPQTWSTDPNASPGIVLNQTGVLPKPFDLSTVYTFEPFQYYHVTVAVGDQVYPSGNWNFKHFLIRTNHCNAKSNASDIDAESELLDVSIIPNPASENARVILREKSSGKIEAVSVTGQIVLTQSFDEQKEVVLDLRDVNSGVYMLRVTSEGRIITESIVKK